MIDSMDDEQKIETERYVGTPLAGAEPATIEQMRTAIMLGRVVHRGRSIVAYEFNGKLYVQGRSHPRSPEATEHE